MSGLKAGSFDSVNISGRNNVTVADVNSKQLADDGTSIQKELGVLEFISDLKNGTVNTSELQRNPLYKGFNTNTYQKIASKKKKELINADVDYKNNTMTFSIGASSGCTHWSPKETYLILDMSFQKSDSDTTVMENEITPCNDFWNKYFRKIALYDENKNNDAFYTQNSSSAQIKKNKKWHDQLPISPSKDTYDPRYNSHILHSSEKLKSVNRRQYHNNADDTTRTNSNITERSDRFRKILKDGGGKFRIPLRFISSFFDIDYLENKIKIEITLETDMSKILERIDKKASATTLAAMVKIASIPKVETSHYQFNAMVIKKEKAIADYTGGKILTSFPSFHEKRRDLEANVQYLSINLPTKGKKLHKIGITLTTTNSYNHSTPYDDHGVELASVEIKNIRLQRAPVYSHEISFDLTKEEDKRQLYDDFLQHHYEGLNSDLTCSYSEYVNHYKMPTYKEYFDRTTGKDARFGQEIIIDLAPTKNSFEIADRTVISDDMILSIDFHDPIPASSATVPAKMLLIRYYFEQTIMHIYRKADVVDDFIKTNYPDQEITYKDLGANKDKSVFQKTPTLKTLTYFE